MSQIVENLKKQQSELANKRFQLKDVLENVEKNLGEITNLLNVIEAVDKERETDDAEPLRTETEIPVLD